MGEFERIAQQITENLRQPNFRIQHGGKRIRNQDDFLFEGTLRENLQKLTTAIMKVNGNSWHILRYGWD